MIPINKPQIDENERQEILKVLNEGILTSASNSGGKRVQDFEGLLADFLHGRLGIDRLANRHDSSNFVVSRVFI